MTAKAKEKAHTLIQKFYASDCEKSFIHDGFVTSEIAKACALICIDEMITVQKDFYGLVLTQPFRDRVHEKVEFLEQVKQAISKYDDSKIFDNSGKTSSENNS